MEGLVRIVRGSEIKRAFPAHIVKVRENGTLWVHGGPILGVTDGTEKKRISALVRAHDYDAIPDEYYTRLGDNPNGLWAGDADAWETHPLKAAMDKEAAEKAAEEAKQVRIYLSSRGWGDYSSCEWVGDITRPDAEILAECRNRLETGHDVDQVNQTDVEILEKITAARKAWEEAPERKAAMEKAEAEDLQRKIDNGYCFNCETYCHGDCGHYSNDPMTKIKRDIREANAEANYSINDWEVE